MSLRAGVGADVAVSRPNPRISASDKFLPREAAFNATALLRPDLDAWLGAGPADRLPTFLSFMIRSGWRQSP